MEGGAGGGAVRNYMLRVLPLRELFVAGTPSGCGAPRSGCDKNFEKRENLSHRAQCAAPAGAGNESYRVCFVLFRKALSNRSAPLQAIDR
ncbi:hypothetical protein EVAR_24010_1 [Eumeta japonica]|uniref:Uncharacterized protein n=1 Tax=Eumeta variegata TaxID=151549 RepID=A0A4C1WA69_EUMVA|nr:hypothetical protein EVAR_24010_1 [Eumeta japonica]